MTGRAAIDRLRREAMETRLRESLRRELEAAPKPTPRDRLWKGLNSPLALFLMSSVVVTAVAGLYSQSQSDARALETRRVALFKLVTEFQYRVSRLERDEDELLGLGPADGKRMAALGADALAVVTGEAANAASAPDYRNVYLGAIADELDLTAGLPGNHELAPEIEGLAQDPCETAENLHGALNILRRWSELRDPLIADGKLPKLPRHVLPKRDQQALVMPDHDRLRAEDGDAAARAGRATLAALHPACDDAG